MSSSSLLQSFPIKSLLFTVLVLAVVLTALKSLGAPTTRVILSTAPSATAVVVGVEGGSGDPSAAEPAKKPNPKNDALRQELLAKLRTDRTNRSSSSSSDSLSSNTNKKNSKALVSVGGGSGGWDDQEPFIGEAVGDTPEWKNTLNTATYIDRFDGTWFIVDCWHHRILLSNDLEAPISQWGTLKIPPPNEFIVPHSMASNGKWLVCESSNGGSNGDNHTVLVFVRDENGKFVFHQSVFACSGNRARRPHRILYHKPTKAFYLYLTNPPHVAKFTANEEGLTEEYCRPIPAMMNAYARSITIVGESLFITAGPTSVTELKLETLELVRYYHVGRLKIKSEKMNDLTFIDGWWYATSVVRCNIFRFRNLHDYSGIQVLTQQLELCYDFDRTAKRCRGGTPYYITKVGGRIYVPYIFHCSGVVSFVDDGDTISDIQHHWGNGWVESAADIAVRGVKW